MGLGATFFIDEKVGARKPNRYTWNIISESGGVLPIWRPQSPGILHDENFLWRRGKVSIEHFYQYT